MKRLPSIAAILPGLALCLGIALIGDFLGNLPLFKDQLRMSGLLLAILLGILIGSLVQLPALFTEGLKIAQKPVLRWAVAGLGLRLTLQEIGRIGGPAIGIVLVCVAVSFGFCYWLSTTLGLSRNLAFLMATGGSICGASAIVAADTVLEADGLEVAVAMGIVTLFGTIGIFIYPWLGSLLHLGDFAYGVLCGSTLHETAQVVAAASAQAKQSVDVATVVKLVRICTLAPMVLGIGWVMRKTTEIEGARAKVPLVPWFLVMFCVFSALVSFGGAEVQTFAATYAAPVVKILLAVGMAGVGLQTNVRDIYKSGWRAVAAGFAQWMVLIAIAAVLIRAFGIPN